MSVPVLIGFAGVLVAAVATGLLAGRCFRQPRLDLILWTASTLALTIALAAQAMGFDRGFSPATFRAVQLFAALLAPLWLGWGLVERVAAGEGARFSVRLLCSALTVVAGVILATDPLSTRAFGKSWPLGSQHYQPIADYVLDAVQAVAVIAAVATAFLAAALARAVPARAVPAGAAVAGNDRRSPAVLAGIGPVALAVLITAALRFSLPSRSLYPLLCLMAAALVWFGATRLTRAPAGAAGRGARAREGARAGRSPRGSGTGRGVLADRYPPVEEYPLVDMYPPADGDGLTDAPYRREDPSGRHADRGSRPGRTERGPYRPVGSGGFGPGNGAPPAYGRPQQAGRPAPGPPPPGPLAPGPPPPGPLGPGPQAAAGSAEQPAMAKPYGRILIFTLLEERVADFDRLAEQTAEQVMSAEPDTLVYVIHLVPNAPMQRIFYEIYRDRAAFDRHENQPYMQRFVADRRSLVLATNVIELRLKFAKVAPLPASSPEPALPAIQRAQLPAGPGPQPPPGQGAQGWGPPMPQSLQPLPPARTQRRYGDG